MSELSESGAPAGAAPRDATLTTPTTGLQLHYRDWGGTGQPFVLLHGLASSAQIWDLVAPALARHGRVVALDARGHGGSAKPDDGYDFATIVADVVGAAQAQDLRRPIVVGHSWGAGVALMYAATEPTCAGVVLVDGGVVDMQARPGATWEEIAQRLAPPDLSHLRLDDLVGTMGQGPLGGLDEAFRRAFFRSLMAEQADGTVRPRLTRARHMAILRAMWDERLAPALARVTCPILVVLAEPPGASDADPFQVAKRQGLEAFAGHPDVAMHTLRDTVHDIPLHRPAALVALIESWLDQHVHAPAVS